MIFCIVIPCHASGTDPHCGYSFQKKGEGEEDSTAAATSPQECFLDWDHMSESQYKIFRDGQVIEVKGMKQVIMYVYVAAILHVGHEEAFSRAAASKKCS